MAGKPKITNRNDRKTFLTSFNLSIPMNFPIGISETVKKELGEIFEEGRMIGLSSYLKKKFLQEQLGVSKESEIISRYFSDDINENFKRLKISILKSTKLHADTFFQQWCSDKIKEFINLKNKKK